MRLVLMAALLAAQTPLAFDVASVKVNTSGDFRRSIGPAPGGRFLVTNTTLRDLLPYAYGLPMSQAGFRIVGGPKWVDEERFDITASVTGTWTPQQMSEMLRTLLADRFKVVAHRETREMPTYALVVTPSLRLKRSAVDQAACDARRAAIQRREPVPAPVPGAPPVCGRGRTIAGTITAVGQTMDTLVTTLAPWVNRVVVDRTQLSGLWDYEVKWTPDQQPVRAPPDSPPIATDPNGPSIFTALQEQLGLKLESTRGPVDVVVIDQAEHPTED